MNSIDDIFGNIDITESYEETSSGNSQSSSDGNVTASSNTSSESSANTSASSANSSDNSGTNKSKTISSQTPANELSITAADIDSIGYADNAEWQVNDNTSHSEGSESSTSESQSTASDTSSSSQKTENTSNLESETSRKHTLNRKGNQGVNTYAHDMLEFRELFLNIPARPKNWIWTQLTSMHCSCVRRAWRRFSRSALS